MRKEVVILLKEEAKKFAEKFSEPERAYNYNAETFNVQEIIPLSETVAAIIMKKSGGKVALVHATYIKNFWFMYFPTDSHVLGMRKIPELLQNIEEKNFPLN